MEGAEEFFAACEMWIYFVGDYECFSGDFGAGGLRDRGM